MVPGSIGPKGCSYSQEEANPLIPLKVINVPNVTEFTYLRVVGTAFVSVSNYNLEAVNNCLLPDFDMLIIVFSSKAKGENNIGIIPFCFVIALNKYVI